MVQRGLGRPLGHERGPTSHLGRGASPDDRGRKTNSTQVPNSRPYSPHIQRAVLDEVEGGKPQSPKHSPINCGLRVHVVAAQRPVETVYLPTSKFKSRLVVSWRREYATGASSFRASQRTGNASRGPGSRRHVFIILTLIGGVLLDIHDVLFLAFAVQLRVVVGS